MHQRADIIADIENRAVLLELPERQMVTDSLALKFERIIRKLNQKERKPIFFYLSGTGGQLTSCLHMSHVMSQSPSPVFMVAYGNVASGCFLLTQAARMCYAVPGTRFFFHHATDIFLTDGMRALREVGMSQLFYHTRLQALQKLDGLQLWMFTRQGRPTHRILDLFEREAELSVPQAIALRLVHGTYSKKELSACRRRMHRISSSSRR